MKIRNEKAYKRERRHLRVRQRVVGTADRPRLCVFRSAKHIYAQIVDDTAGRTIVAASSLKLSVAAPEPVAEAKPEAKGKEKESKGKDKKSEKKDKKAWIGGRKTTAAREVGKLIADAAKEKGITAVCFDRGGHIFHGRIAALAEAARKNGLRF